MHTKDGMTLELPTSVAGNAMISRTAVPRSPTALIGFTLASLSGLVESLPRISRCLWHAQRKGKLDRQDRRPV